MHKILPKFLPSLIHFNSAIHKATSLTVPSHSLVLTGTIPVEQKMSIGYEWELLGETVFWLVAGNPATL